ncbi:MAG: RimK family alpha-L-glutamate ligase [Acidobacteriota bacterium]
MNILILSRKKQLYSTKRLIEVAQRKGHNVKMHDPLNLLLILGKKNPTIHLKSGFRRIRDIDVVLPRIGASITDYGLAVVNQFSMMGIPTVNKSQPIARSRDKFRCLQLLSRYDIDIPKTVMVKTPEQIRKGIAMVGGPPVILKLLKGTQGIGVMLANDVGSVESVISAIWSLGQNIMIQEFVGESKGKDIRVLVVGGRIIAAMRREAQMDEFRSNIHRGGSGKAVSLSDEYARVAIEATKVIGLEIAGVDMLESRIGPKVVEINSSVGFEGLEKATGVDIAEVIIDYTVMYAEKSRMAR